MPRKKPETIKIQFERSKWTARVMRGEKTILVFRTKDYTHLLTFLSTNMPSEA